MTPDEAKTMFIEGLKEALANPYLRLNNVVTREIKDYAKGCVPLEKYGEMMGTQLNWEQITVSYLTKDNNEPYNLPNNKVLIYCPTRKKWDTFIKM